MRGGATFQAEHDMTDTAGLAREVSMPGLLGWGLLGWGLLGWGLFSCSTTIERAAPDATRRNYSTTPAATLEASKKLQPEIILVSVGPRQLPALVVDGTEALETAARLRASAVTTGQYPVIVGEFSRATAYLQAVRFEAAPHELLQRSASMDLNPGNWIRGRAPPEESNTELRALLDRAAEYNNAERRRIFEATSIPSGKVPPMELVGHYNMLQGIPFRSVLIVLIPSTQGWQAPAYLSFGGFGDCPRPEEHTRILRYWYEEYGAKLVTVGADILELEVEQPLTDPESALQLARIQYDYCPDVASQKGTTLGGMAAALMQRKIWYFWWD